MPRDGVRDESRHARASTARAKHVSPSSPTRGIHGARHRASSPRQRASTPMTRAADRTARDTFDACVGASSRRMRCTYLGYEGWW